MSKLFLKCIKDTEGWWTEGEIYEASRVYGSVTVCDNFEPNEQEWYLTYIGDSRNGSACYQVGCLKGEVLFEEAAQ